MNNKEYEKISEELNGEFQSNRGRGYCYIQPPLNPYILVYNTVSKLINKRNDIKILIVVLNYDERLKLGNVFKDNFSKNIRVLSLNYISTVKQEYDCFISVGLNYQSETITNLANKCKFALVIFTKNTMNTDFIHKIETSVPSLTINTIRETAQKLIKNNIYSPVEEYRYGVYINDTDRELYNKYDEYVKNSMTIFGDLSGVDNCLKGNHMLGMSAIDCCYQIARNNGWNPNLDNSIEYNRQLDSMFNPIAIKERATTIFNIINLRKKLITDNDAKLETIKNIIEENSNKRILIVSPRGEFCNKLSKYLTENNITNLGYHNELEDSYLSDENGDVVRYKAGEHKGEPKLFKSAALSTNNLKGFNAGYCNVLIMKGSSDNSIETSADIIIYTSPILDNIFQFKSRFDKIKLPIPLIMYKVYCIDTNEERIMLKEKENSLIKVYMKNIAENLMLDEISGDIIL